MFVCLRNSKEVVRVRGRVGGDRLAREVKLFRVLLVIWFGVWCKIIVGFDMFYNCKGL